MKILILEDDENRIEQFSKKLFSKAHLFFYDNVALAKEHYHLISPDVIFLDHDLDHRQMVDSGEENTGYQFAKFLSTIEGIEKISIYIHSMNPVGADNIHSVLPHAMKIPFSILIKEIN